jgi:hypothetical protein
MVMYFSVGNKLLLNKLISLYCGRIYRLHFCFVPKMFSLCCKSVHGVSFIHGHADGSLQSTGHTYSCICSLLKLRVRVCVSQYKA